MIRFEKKYYNSKNKSQSGKSKLLQIRRNPNILFSILQFPDNNKIIRKFSVFLIVTRNAMNRQKDIDKLDESPAYMLI